MYIIPIGVDCGNTELLKSLNLRVFSFPFHWIVTYNGISNILKTNFSEFFNIDQKNSMKIINYFLYIILFQMIMIY